MRTRIYVAGPISRGDFLANIRLALDAADMLRDAGLLVYVPHLDMLQQLVHPRSYEDLLAHDFGWLEACHAVLRLPGDSPGADREIAHARKLNIPVFEDIWSVAAWAHTRS